MANSEKRRPPLTRYGAFCVLITAFGALAGTTYTCGMGFFEKFTRPSPETQRLVDLKKQQLEQEAAGIREQITAWRDTQIARANAEHAARVAPIEQHIEAGKREMADMGKRTMLGIQCSRLMVGLLGPLTDELRRSEVSDMRGAMRGLRDEIEKQADTLKQNPNDETLQEFEHWAIERAGEKAEKVLDEFKKFRERLVQDGIALG